jgi:serine/threonine-protein kinase
MMLAHVRETPVPLSEKAGHEVPAALELIVMRCLEKNPADRYASAEELVRALAGCSGTGELWTRERARKWWLLNAPESVAVAAAQVGSTLTQQATL